jgi:SSS family transporter
LLALDWIVICAYLLGLLALSFYLSRKQNSAADYFLGGRKMPPGALAASTIATQCSTNSLLGAPAFVGFVAGGGMIWLQYELAVPLAMLALLWLMLPARRYGVTSIYEILEIRLGRKTRLTAAACFLLFRGVATGVTIYASALVIALILELDLFTAVLLIMTGTLLYDYLAGMTAVVISDVIQLALLLGAVLFSLFFIGGLIDWQFLAVDRKQTLINDWGFSGQDYGFWPMLIGGIFLYAAYYGCDQSQAQRILAARSETDTAKVLLYNGIFRFPIVLLYCFLGLGLAVLATQDALIVDALPDTSAGEKNLNLVFPVFVLRYFEPGFIGLVMVGLIAASMSSIDSALNSLSAVTVEDFVRPHLNPDMNPQTLLSIGRACTLMWGLFAVVFAFQVERIAPTVLETVNKVGSMVNGPLLALIGSAMFLRGLAQRYALLAFALGLIANLFVAFYLPAVSWLWWNVVGFVITLLTAAMAAKLGTMPADPPGGVSLFPRPSPPRSFPPLLLAAFVAIFGVCLGLQTA